MLHSVFKNFSLLYYILQDIKCFLTKVHFFKKLLLIKNQHRPNSEGSWIALTTAIHALNITPLDYCNRLLCGQNFRVQIYMLCQAQLWPNLFCPSRLVAFFVVAPHSGKCFFQKYIQHCLSMPSAKWLKFVYSIMVSVLNESHTPEVYVPHTHVHLCQET